MITKKNLQNKKHTLLLLLSVGIAAFSLRSGQLLARSAPQSAANQFVPVGTTTQVPLDEKQEKPYVYESVDPDFWQEVENQLNNGNYMRVISNGFAVGEDFGADSDDALEGQLAAGVALRKMKIYYAATLIFEDIIKKKLSSELAQKALYELSLIDEESIIDPVEVVDDLLNSNEFGILHPDIQSFVSYYVSISDLINGFKNWSAKQAEKVKVDSYWAQKTNYLKGLNEVAQGKLDDAEARFNKLNKNEKVFDYFKKRTSLQLARIAFEKKDYVKANGIYHDLRDFPAREEGRILLERAWTLFYLKDYSEALGLLQALKAPIYSISVTPERYILEMLIYKELCYYDKVSLVAHEFYDVFDDALKTIRKRHDYRKSDVIQHMALTNMRLQVQANLIDQLRQESVQVKDLDLKKYPFFKNIEERYENKDREIQQRLYLKMQSLFPQLAEQILDYEEQVKFLDYTAKLDALRIIRPGEDRNYKAEKMSYIKFNKIFWPVENEYWVDELDDYRVLIKSQCDQTTLTPADENDNLKQFGKEFN